MADVTSDPGSLQHLHDIVLPAPVPWWPPAPGWYALAIIMVAVLVGLAIRWAYHHRSNRYRREALAELEVVYRTVQSPGNRAAALENMAVLIKRVALISFGRSKVASLSGDPWRRFLADVGRTEALTPEIRRLMDKVLSGRVDDAALTDEAVRQLFEAARSWIHGHRLSPEAKGIAC